MARGIPLKQLRSGAGKAVSGPLCGSARPEG
jgi:hypothetical protein